MEKVKYSIIYFFFTHFFLRRIGKKYPDFFKKWMADTTDILKDISKADSAMAKSCYYDSMSGASDDKKY
jgi:hypothetical protein